MNTTVEIIERARPALKRLQLGLDEGVACPAIGRAVVRLLRRHFLALPPNKWGFPTTHFWARAADATKFEVTRHSVRISINQTGVRQRFLGEKLIPFVQNFSLFPSTTNRTGVVRVTLRI